MVNPPISKLLWLFATRAASEANTPLQFIRIYERDHHAVGYLWYSLEERSAFLLDVMLLPSHQGQGMGKEIIQALIHELRVAGAEELELRVAPHNQRAIRLVSSSAPRAL